MLKPDVNVNKSSEDAPPKLSVDQPQVDRGQHEVAIAGSAASLSEVAQAEIRNWLHFTLLFLAILAVQFDASIDVFDLVMTTFVAIPTGFVLYFGH